MSINNFNWYFRRLILFLSIGMLYWVSSCASGASPNKRIDWLERHRYGKGEFAIISLIWALNDESDQVKKVAQNYLIEIGKPAVGPLLAELNKPYRVRCKSCAAFVLGEIGDIRAVNRLLVLKTDQALPALVKLGENAIDPLISQVKTIGGQGFDIKTNDKLYRAKKALIEIGAPAVSPLLNELDLCKTRVTDRPYSKFGKDIIEVLGEINDSRAIDHLTRILSDDLVRPEFKIISAQALGKIKGDTSVDSLISALRSWSKKEPQRNGLMDATVKALIGIGEPAIPKLILSLSHRDYSVRAGTACILGQIRDNRAVRPLVEALNDKHPLTREEAALALANMQAPIAVTPLLKLLDDQHDNVIVAAIQALGQLVDNRSVMPLIAKLKTNPDNETRDKKSGWRVLKNAALALGHLGDDRAVEPLIKLFGHADKDVQRCAVLALSNINSHLVISNAINLLNHKDYRIRLNAAWTIGEAKAIEAILPLVQRLADLNRHVRQKTTWALAEMKEKAAGPVLNFINQRFGRNYPDLEYISKNYNSIIAKGDDGSEVLLLQALKKYPSIGMAQSFMNSGNGLLSGAGYQWANEAGYKVIRIPTGENKSNPPWARQKRSEQ